MTETLRSRYPELQDVITAAEFPELDLALRRGQHIDREDFALFTLLTEAQDHLEAFYRRFGCELVHKMDGYFYLLPTGDKLSRRQLTPGDMLVGQALALLYLDPSTIERGGRTTAEDVVAQLVVVLGSDTLMHAFNPNKKRKLDERVAQKNVRARIGEGIRHLAALGFVDVADDDSLRLRPSLLRFAEPVRGLSEPAEALARLVATGEVALVTEESEVSLDAEELGTDDRDVENDNDSDDHDDDRRASDRSPAMSIVDASAVAPTTATVTATAFASLLSSAPEPSRADEPADPSPTSLLNTASEPASPATVIARAEPDDDDHEEPYAYQDPDEDL